MSDAKKIVKIFSDKDGKFKATKVRIQVLDLMQDPSEFWKSGKVFETNGKRDYKDEYKKFQSSTKSKKYRAELNKYNRDRGTYGNGDGKDASHKGGKIVGYEEQSKNRGRREKSRLKKKTREDIDMNEQKLRKVIREILNEGKRIQIRTPFKDWRKVEKILRNFNPKDYEYKIDMSNKYVKTIDIDKNLKDKFVSALEKGKIPIKLVKEGMNESLKIGTYDIGMAHKGNGTVVYDRNQEESGDYKNIAHISNDGKVKFYDKKIPNNIKKLILNYAKLHESKINEAKKPIEFKIGGITFGKDYQGLKSQNGGVRYYYQKAKKTKNMESDFGKFITKISQIVDRNTREKVATKLKESKLVDSNGGMDL